MSSLPASVRSRWFDVSGIRMHVRVPEGPAPVKRTPIVLVHGMVVSSRYMTRLATYLGPHFPTYAPDLPGYGRSAQPDHLLTLPELADWLVAWMDAADLERAALVGNSFGCQIAVEAAVRHPQRVASLVLQGPTSEPGRRSAWQQLWGFLVNGARDSGGMLSILLRDYWAAGLRQALHTFAMCRKDRIEDKLGRIQVPGLVITGSRDPIAPPRWGKQVAALLPHGRHTLLPGVAHTAVFAAPRQVARAVRAFLREQPVGATTPDPEDRPPHYVAVFDSATTMLRASGAAVHGEALSGLGLGHVERLAPFANRLPRTLRREIYRLAGGFSAIGPAQLGKLSLEQIDAWITGHYPERRYPAVFLGSANGAVTHLAAAMGVPWLPQTLLIPVRRWGSDVNDAQAALAWGRQHGPSLLARHPDLQLHHMHDPNQDYLMSRHMAYFRIKRRRLGQVWSRFLERCLEPGGVIYVVACEQGWPCTRVAERHYFQLGGVGGLSPQEYLEGGPRVAELLHRQGVRRRRWDAPLPDVTAPEAEWGFEEALAEDVSRLAAQRGYQVRYLRFPHPDALSPAVAELYRDWYRARGLPDERLLVESFVLLAPFWTLRTGSIPYWCSFGVERAAQVLDDYLTRADPFERIYMMLFSHGVESAGLAPIARWRQLLGRGRQAGAFVGVSPRAYPQDFGVLRRYPRALPHSIRARHALPEPLSVAELERWLDAQTRAAPERLELR